jgi:hypothetical protein
MVARWGDSDDGHARARARRTRGDDAALWIAAALLDLVAAWMLASAARPADVVVGATALAISLLGLWWAIARPPACARRAARPGESAARYYGLRDLGAAPAALQPPPIRPPGSRFMRTAAGPPVTTAAPRRPLPPPRPTPFERYAQVEADGRRLRHGAAQGPLGIDWDAFDAARATWDPRGGPR